MSEENNNKQNAGIREIEVLKTSIKGIPGVIFISEAGFDSEFHTQEAWDNLLAFIAGNPDIKVVVVDGAVSRLDRPEYLSAEKLLTYWNTSKEDAEKISEEIKNHEQYATMVQTQLQILEERLAELRKKCPTVKMVLMADSDNASFSFTAMMNELMLIKQQTIFEKIQAFGASISGLKSKCRNLKARLTAKLSPSKAAKLEKSLKSAESNIGTERARKETLQEEQKLYRVKKVRPMHQVMTRELMETTYDSYRKLCSKLGINFVASHLLMVLEGEECLIIDYTHSRHYTWSALKNGGKKWFQGMHGKMARYLEIMRKATGGKNVDAVVQSHHGSGFKRTQRTRYQPDSLNFSDINRFDSKVTEEYLTFVGLPTFEDQRKVAAFLHGQRPDRLGVAGKPMGSRNNPAVDRYRNGGKTGVTVLTKNKLGLCTQFISYDNFASSAILASRENYSAVAISSDEHIGHPAEDPLARLGFLVLYQQLLTNGMLFRGKSLRACGYINAGDLGEANSESWKHRPDHRLSADRALQKAFELCAVKQENQEEMLKKVMDAATFAMSGLVENMGDMMEAVAEYLVPFLTLGLEHSDLKYVLCAVPGNHAANILSRHGLKELFAFEQRVKQMGVGIFEAGRSGESDNNDDPNVRVALGGYEVSLAINLQKYGLSKNGKPIFGPLNLFVAHDPKGENETGLVGALRNSNADLAIAGHTHEEWIELSNTEDNSWSVALRVPTLQKTTATEVKYANTPPRTSGALIIVMPQPGDFSEIFIDINTLRRLGMEDIKQRLFAASEKPKKK